MKKRIISFIIVCLLSLSCLTVLSSADAQLSNANDVITPELREVMNASKAADKIPVSIWTEEIDSAEVEELALKKTGFNKASIRALVEQGKGDTVTLDDVNEYIAVERKLYAEKQQSANQKFAGKYTFLTEAKSKEDAYVCSYAPMIVVKLTKSQIETLAKDSAVNTMYYSPKTESKNEMDVSIPLINAKYNRDTNGYTGERVKIGMVEPAIPNDSISSLTNSNIVTNPETLEELEQIYTDIDQSDNFDNHVRHATAVAEIMVSTLTFYNGVYQGIVPQAQLYAASLNISGGFWAAVEWLLQNNVQVINMSAEIYRVNNPARGQYTQYERWVDHIAHNHSVHFVKSAGNNGGSITHPGLAYNVITVGAIDDNGTIALADDAIWSSSSFAEITNSSNLTPPNKPDVVAPGANIATPSHASSGTSYAAPHVTGVVAQLIEQYPSLAVLQDLMKAILTAAVSHDTLRYTSTQTTGFEKCGAGVIDARACSEISYRGTFVSSAFTAAQNNIPKTYTFNVTSADNRIRVSLAWLKSIWFSSAPPHPSDAVPSTDAPIANLDLAIIGPSGNELPLNAFINYDSNTNLAIIEFDPDVYGTGTYTVNVWIRNSTGAPTYFGLAWWADRN